jgi:chaperone required for assembly of F1-ATPase
MFIAALIMIAKNVEPTKTPLCWWKDKDTLVYLHDGIFLIRQNKEWNPIIFSTHTCRNESVNLVEEQNRIVITRHWEGKEAKGWKEHQ